MDYTEQEKAIALEYLINKYGDEFVNLAAA